MKRPSKNSKQAICYLCGDGGIGSGGLTRDHVFPCGLFVDPKPANLLTLPCCYKCQQDFDLDEQYFRNMLASSGRISRLQPTGKAIWAKALRSIRSSRAMHHAHLRELASLEVRSEGGLILGEVTGVRIDMKRFYRVIGKIIRGLHYHHLGSVVTDKHEVTTYFDNKKPLESIECARYGQSFGDVVSYRGASTDDGSSSIWWIWFYKSHFANGVVIDPSAPETPADSISPRQQ